MKETITTIQANGSLFSKSTLAFLLYFFLQNHALNAQTTFTFDDVAINTYTTTTSTAGGETIQLVVSNESIEIIDDGSFYPNSPVIYGRT